MKIKSQIVKFLKPSPNFLLDITRNLNCIKYNPCRDALWHVSTLFFGDVFYASSSVTNLRIISVTSVAILESSCAKLLLAPRKAMLKVLSLGG